MTYVVLIVTFGRLKQSHVPLNPWSPWAPVGPVAPVTPVGPVGPVAPTPPVAPAGEKENAKTSALVNTQPALAIGVTEMVR